MWQWQASDVRGKRELLRCRDLTIMRKSQNRVQREVALVLRHASHVPERERERVESRKERDARECREKELISPCMCKSIRDESLFCSSRCPFYSFLCVCLFFPSDFSSFSPNPTIIIHLFPTSQPHYKDDLLFPVS